MMRIRKNEPAAKRKNSNPEKRNDISLRDIIPKGYHSFRTGTDIIEKAAFRLLFHGGDGGIRTHGPAHHQSNDFESFSL